jgi:uncharacterized RDD family membrane protein YckC
MEGYCGMEQPSRVDKYGSLIIDFITNILIITLIFMNSQSNLVKFIAILIPLVYYPILHTIFSRSIGDIVFSLKIVDQRGNKIGYRLALERFICVIKYSFFILLFTNILFLFFFSRTGTDIREVSTDFEGESKTYLVKAD